MNLVKIVLIGLVAFVVGGCSSSPEPISVVDERCKKGGELLPEWVCTSAIDGFSYSAVGIGDSNSKSLKNAQAISRARAELAHQVSVTVKAKTEDFLRSTGVGANETVDVVTTVVSKQVAKVNLVQSKKMKEHTSKNGDLYVLVTVPDETVNEQVKVAFQDGLKSSFKDNNAMWQQFQSKQSLESLDKEFPTN